MPLTSKHVLVAEPAAARTEVNTCPPTAPGAWMTRLGGLPSRSSPRMGSGGIPLTTALTELCWHADMLFTASRDFSSASTGVSPT